MGTRNEWRAGREEPREDCGIMNGERNATVNGLGNLKAGKVMGNNLSSGLAEPRQMVREVLS
jgi:hypothetical protein